MIEVEVYISLKETVLDPEGLTIKKALNSIGYSEVLDVRFGKYIVLKLDIDDKKTAEEKAKEFCEKLLANTVIETYSIKIK